MKKKIKKDNKFSKEVKKAMGGSFVSVYKKTDKLLKKYGLWIELNLPQGKNNPVTTSQKQETKQRLTEEVTQ